MGRFLMHRIFAGLLFTGIFSPALRAQTEHEKLTSTILHLDSLFWNGYNTCDTAKTGIYLAGDLEFYHDKGGITLGSKALNLSLQNNLCSNPDWRLRREAVEGTVHVFPMEKDNKIYGAILMGEHVFYILEKGKEERVDGHASFTHLWLLQDGSWKMSRILSYDHGPAKYINKRKEVSLAPAKLDKFGGTYKGSKSGELILIHKENTGLVMTIGSNKYVIYPETESRFFSKDRDLTFEFVPASQGKPKKLVIRELGKVVEEAEFVSGK